MIVFSLASSFVSKLGTYWVGRSSLLPEEMQRGADVCNGEEIKGGGVAIVAREICKRLMVGGSIHAFGTKI